MVVVRKAPTRRLLGDLVGWSVLLLRCYSAACCFLQRRSRGAKICVGGRGIRAHVCNFQLLLPVTSRVVKYAHSHLVLDY